MAKFCHAEEYSLGDVFDGKTSYIVPDYQRGYIWKDEKVNDLWNDLIGNYQNHPEEEYLLGPIVTVQKPLKEPNEIVDGQQRLITLTLIFCAFRNIIKKTRPKSSDDQGDYDDLVNSLNKLIQFNDNDVLIEMNNSDDNRVFCNICNGKNIENFPKTSVSTNYNTLLKSATRLCNDYFKKLTYRNALREIRNILEVVKTNTSFVNVEITDEKHSYQVFESLNSKGEPLKQTALIKSHLLHIQKNNNIKSRWDKMMKEPTIEKDPDDFLYYSMLSRADSGKKEITKSTMYKTMKETCTKPEDVDTYLEGLDEDQKIIVQLNVPNRLILNNTIQDSDQIIHSLNGMLLINARYFRRPVITACRKWGFSAKTKKLVDCLVKFFFMYRIICKLDIDPIKRIAREVTYQIHNEEELDEIFRTILKNNSQQQVIDHVSKERFVQDFRLYASNKIQPKIAYYILCSFEYYLNESIGVSVNLEKMETEHIFPKKPKKDKWNNKDELSEYGHRLGNLTLLNRGWNASLSNRSFKDKLLRGDKCYNKSGIELNKNYLTKYSQWRIMEIKDREEQLVKLAEKVWDLNKFLST